MKTSARIVKCISQVAKLNPEKLKQNDQLFISMFHTISVTNRSGALIFYMHHKDGECAGTCTCDRMHQMEKTVCYAIRKNSTKFHTFWNKRQFFYLKGASEKIDYYSVFLIVGISDW